MVMINVEGLIDVVRFEKLCRDHSPALNPHHVVFIFPSNSGHHTATTTLFSSKSGGGLAAAAGSLHQAGFPTLGLPTTTMEEWETDRSQKRIVQGAIADLYRAVGAGYNLMLPIRAHNPTRGYFETCLTDSKGYKYEPSFWGGIQTASNKPLANHYILELNNLLTFMALSKEAQKTTAEGDISNLFYASFLHGLRMKDDDAWLGRHGRATIAAASVSGSSVAPRNITSKPTPAPAPKPAAPPPSSTYQAPISTNAPKLRLKMPGESYSLSQARARLDGYTRGYSSSKLCSCLSLFFHGNWNHHHIVEVAKIVDRMDGKSDAGDKITSSEELLEALKSIQIINNKGSLAKHIEFIENQFKTPVDIDHGFRS